MPSESAIFARAQEEGVSASRVAAYFRTKREDVAMRYPEKSRAWQANYVETLVWEHYFPGEPFPGNVKVDRDQSSADEPAGTSRLDRIFSADTPITRTINEDAGRPWVHDKFSSTVEHSDRKENPPSARVSDYYPPVGRSDSYKPPGSSRIDSYRPKHESTPSPPKRKLSHSSWDNIPTGPAASRPDKNADLTLRQMVISAGFGAKEYETTQQSCHEQVRAKHSERVLSQEWLKWKEESLIWRRFFDPKPFPFKEPSWASHSKGLGPGGGLKYDLKECLTAFPTKIPAVVEEVDKRGIPGPTEYFTLEKRMEAMAKARGGLEFRRQFFQHLQRMRDRANQEHKDCDKSVRAFMADKLTWNKFFEEPFPGRKPLGGHTKTCMRRSDRTEEPSTTTPTRSRQPLTTVTNRTRPVVQLPPAQSGKCATESRTFSPSLPKCVDTHPIPPPAAYSQPMPESSITSQTFKTVSVQGSQISCSMEALKNISYSVIKDTKYELVGRALNCEFIIHQTANGNGLCLRAAPLKEGDTSAAERGAGFLHAWVGEVLERGPIEMSEYWLDFCTANGVPQHLVEGIRNRISVYDKEAATGDISVGKNWAGLSKSLTCPENQWELYTEAFAASDIDRLVIEESAKAEGLLRMVHDEETGEVITLGEYEKRILCRFVGLVQTETTRKRKADDEEEEEDNYKRIKVDEEA